MWFACIFSHSVGCLFTILTVSLDTWKCLILLKCYLSVYSLVAYTFGVISKKSLLNLLSWNFPPMFSSKGFVVLALRFRSLIHLELILHMYLVRAFLPLFIFHVFSNKVCEGDITCGSKNCETILSLFSTGFACLQFILWKLSFRPLAYPLLRLTPFSSRYGLSISICS